MQVLTTHHRHSDGRTFHSIFLDVCRQAYLCIRLHHERILRFVLPLVDAGMTDLNMETVQHIRSQVRLELTEEAAWAAFETELDMCSRDNSKRIDETGRRVAKILSKDNTIEQTELLRHELTKLQLQIGFNVLLPFGLKVGPVVPEKCSVMRSKAKPFMLVRLSAVPCCMCCLALHILILTFSLSFPLSFRLSKHLQNGASQKKMPSTCNELRRSETLLCINMVTVQLCKLYCMQISLTGGQVL